MALFAITFAQGPYQAGIESGPPPDPDSGRTRHVTFDTVPGCRYELFTSTDLVTWSPVAPTFYGFGGNYSVHVFTDGLIPAPGGEPGPPVDPPPRFEPLLTQFGTGGAGVTLLSFTGEDGQPYQTLLSEVFDDLDIAGGYLDPVSGYQFTWLRMSGTWFPGYNDLDDLDEFPQGEQGKVQAFIDAYPAIAAAGAAGSGGVVTQFDPGEARFWRVEKQEIDTDSDGLPDWQEFEMGLSAFNADSDFDLVSDGVEVAAGTNALDPQSAPPPAVSLRMAEKTLWVHTDWSCDYPYCVADYVYLNGMWEWDECAYWDCESQSLFLEGELRLNGQIVWFSPPLDLEGWSDEDIADESRREVAAGLTAFFSAAIPQQPLSATSSPATTVTSWGSEAAEEIRVDAAHRNVWLQTDHGAHNGISRTWLVVHETSPETPSGNGASWTVQAVGTVTLTVPPGETRSTTQTYTGPQALDPHFTVSGGTATLKPTIAVGLNRRISLQPVDLDVDADNTTVTGYPDTQNNDRGTAEEAAEDSDDLEKYPGVRIYANRIDEDEDGVPGYADGIDKFGNNDAGSNREFEPLLFDAQFLDMFPNATFVFEYSASDPDQLTQEGSGATARYILPDENFLRIWKGDGPEVRKTSSADNFGDFIQNGDPYSAADLGWQSGDNVIRLYIEAVKPSFGPSYPIELKFYPLGIAQPSTVTTLRVNTRPYYISQENPSPN